VREHDVRHESVDRALVALHAGRYGDSEERAAVKALADRLDGLAWDIQERVACPSRRRRTNGASPEGGPASY
jgi:hypothetical protein